MHIRPAQLADIDALCNIDHTFNTDYVWQLNGKEDPNEFSAQFRLSRLPRQIRVPFAHDARHIKKVIHRCDYVWVMQGDETDNQLIPNTVRFSDGTRGILGYAGMATLPWQGAACVPVLCVALDWRRKGVATQLLRTAMAQAKTHQLHTITLDVQTKNYPATKLLQARGFRFAGYADNYYPSQDIAMFFAYRIR